MTLCLICDAVLISLMVLNLRVWCLMDVTVYRDLLVIAYVWIFALLFGLLGVGVFCLICCMIALWLLNVLVLLVLAFVGKQII